MNPALVEDFRARKRAGKKLVALTAYDYPTARLLSEEGVDFILVGDSLGMVVLGMPDTTRVTMEHMLHHCEAVARGAGDTLVGCDLPAGSTSTPEAALANAKRLVNAGAGAVKIEGSLLPQVDAILAEGIPVMGHLGMLPQNVLIEGGYHRKGKDPESEARLIQDALALEKSGVFGIVLEIVAHAAAAHISESLSIPTIGIGSGEGCDGQILVTHDLIGLFPWFRPSFAKPEGDAAEVVRKAVRAYSHRVRG